MTFEELQLKFINEHCASGVVSFDKLPEFERKVLQEVLVPLLPNVPVEAILMALNGKLTQAVMIDRVKMKWRTGIEIPINYYGITFMPSGGGKDKILSYIDRMIMSPVIAKMEELTKAYKQQKLEDVTTLATQKFQRSGAEREKYIQNNSPRDIEEEFSMGTMEGLIAQREALGEAGFGGTLLQVSEFGKFIMDSNVASDGFLSLLTDIYEYGDNKPKVTKGERQMRPVKGVPSTALLHTALYGLDEPTTKRRLMTFLNQGIARRSFFCYVPENHYKAPDGDLDEEYELELASVQNGIVNSEPIRQYIADILIELSPNEVIGFDTEADKLIFAYEIYCQLRANKLKQTLDLEGVRGELTSRHWRAARLAARIAVFAKVSKIGVKEVRQAIYQAELFAAHFGRFYRNSNRQDVEKVLDLLRSSAEPLSRGDISDSGIYKGREFSRWLNGILKELEDGAAFNAGYELKTAPYGKNAVRYYLEPII